jgi:hypothetical protein
MHLFQVYSVERRFPWRHFRTSAWIEPALVRASLRPVVVEGPGLQRWDRLNPAVLQQSGLPSD